MCIHQLLHRPYQSGHGNRKWLLCTTCVGHAGYQWCFLASTPATSEIGDVRQPEFCYPKMPSWATRCIKVVVSAFYKQVADSSWCNYLCWTCILSVDQMVPFSYMVMTLYLLVLKVGWRQSSYLAWLQSSSSPSAMWRGTKVEVSNFSNVCMWLILVIAASPYSQSQSMSLVWLKSSQKQMVNHQDGAKRGALQFLFQHPNILPYRCQSQWRQSINCWYSHVFESRKIWHSICCQDVGLWPEESYSAVVVFIWKIGRIP